MASALNLLQAYNDSDEENNQEAKDDKENENKIETNETGIKPIDPSFSIASSISIDSAPVVLYSVIFYSF